ncbi:MAG: hypothetical protein II766_01480 [Paludibacteraceae bacterium]|nr:hypothetical protein [Paludibacteraceae bacterium]
MPLRYACGAPALRADVAARVRRRRRAAVRSAVALRRPCATARTRCRGVAAWTRAAPLCVAVGCAAHQGNQQRNDYSRFHGFSLFCVFSSVVTTSPVPQPVVRFLLLDIFFSFFQSLSPCVWRN